jgi:amino acid adenylation domain-containing protein
MEISTKTTVEHTELSFVSQEHFWKNFLSGINASIFLDGISVKLKDNPSVAEYKTKVAYLDQSLASDFNDFILKYDLEVFPVLQGLWTLLLSRYSGDEDIVFGIQFVSDALTTSTNQSNSHLIPFRLNAKADTLLLPWLHQIQSQWRDLQTYCQVPLSQIQAWSDIPSGMTMFDTVMILGDLEQEFTDLSNHPITIGVNIGSELIFQVRYDRNRFEETAIARLLGHLQTLLESIVTNPNQNLANLSILTPAERHQILTEWNDTSTDYPQDKCIHQLFEEQVERTPDAIAVSFQDQQLTYRELNNRANQLAHYLQNLGVKPDVLVGICVERSLEMIVGLLGILKAGGAYLPLDPAYPTERLAYMLSDSQMTVLVTQHDLVSILPEHEAKIVCLDTDRNIVSQEIEENLLSDATPEQLIYVIYTSGSTGKPKGVETTHRGVARLLLGVNYINLNAENKFLQIAPISFDASTLEIWGALLFGAQCVLFPEKVPTSTDLRKVIQKHGITTMWLTSALFNSIVDTDPKALEGIRELFTGGEALSVNHVERAIKALPSTQIVNGYGPTESTTFACCYPIPKKLDKSIQSIPIGRPIGNTQIYILDNNLQPVPIGVSGEIYIGGAGLARGYLNRQDLTEAKFVHNPFGAGRLYQTGDFARYKNNGDIEFLGRIDNQVKIRGFRIELGEIETVLSQHPNIRVTVVTVREDIPDDKRIVAYIVVSDEKVPTANDLREFLAQNLPMFMLPSSFVVLDVLPLTPNGKVDRRALLALDIEKQLDEEVISPRDELEQQLATVWQKLLGIDRVSIHANFFELGGNSLISVRLVAEIEKIFNYHFPLSSFFQIGTIAEIAKWMREKPSETISPDDIPAGLNIDDYRAFLTLCAGRIGKHIGKRGLIVEVPPTEMKSSQPFIWIGYTDFSKNLGLSQPVYTMPGGSWTPLHSTENYIEAIASVIVDELLSVPQDEPYLIGGNCYEGIVAMEVAHQLQSKGKKVAFLAIIDKPGSSRTYYKLRQLDLKLCTLKFHLMQFLPLSLADKGKYIIKRLFPLNARQEISKSESARDFNQSLIEQSPKKLNRPLNEYDRILPEAFDSIDQASKNHNSKGFSGRIVLTAPTKSGLKSGTKDVLWTDLSWFFPYYGWEKLLTGKVELHKLDCVHADVGMKQNAEQIGQIIWKASEEFR